VNDRPQWRTVKNGSRQYVDKAAKRISHIHLNSPVTSVERMDGKVTVTSLGKSEIFDKVILAAHSPVANQILQNKTVVEEKILSAISYESNRTILHSDPAFMPKEKRCWSSWNVLGTGKGGFAKKVSLTYFINMLQSLPTKNNYFVTLNPHSEIYRPWQEFSYDHPKFDQMAIRAQRDIDLIQGNGGVYFAGAWTRYGFHEDGILSAVKVSELLGVKAPWNQLTESLS
jgi:predicted NAD/FAD-binding protein